MHAPLSTDVPVLLLNQPDTGMVAAACIISKKKSSKLVHTVFACTRLNAAVFLAFPVRNLFKGGFYCKIIFINAKFSAVTTEL